VIPQLAASEKGTEQTESLCESEERCGVAEIRAKAAFPHQ